MVWISRSCRYLRSCPLVRSVQFSARQPKRWIKTSSNPAKASKEQVEKLLYPQTLLIYTNGTLRNNVVVTVKFLVLLGSLINIGYRFSTIEDMSNLSTNEILSVLGGMSIALVPPILLHLVIHPYVASISILLPKNARTSKQAFETFIKTFTPNDQKLFVTRLTFLGFPSRRGAINTVDNIFPLEQRWGRLANYQNVAGVNRMFGFGQKFYIDNLPKAENLSRYPGVWTKLANFIKEDTDIMAKLKSK
jgi:hypothetical protein